MNSSTRILLIDESAERAVTLTKVLNDSGYTQVAVCSPHDSVLDYINEINPQVIFIDVYSPTRDTLEQLTIIRDEHPTPVVLLSQDDNVQTIESAFECGVTAYISDEMNSAQAKPIINMAMLTFASFQGLKQQLDVAKSKLEDQKTIERAKGILMSDHQLSEEVAYQKLRKFAMDEKRKMADVARQIIEVKKMTS